MTSDTPSGSWRPRWSFDCHKGWADRKLTRLCDVLGWAKGEGRWWGIALPLLKMSYLPLILIAQIRNSRLRDPNWFPCHGHWSSREAEVPRNIENAYFFGKTLLGEHESFNSIPTGASPRILGANNLSSPSHLNRCREIKGRKRAQPYCWLFSKIQNTGFLGKAGFEIVDKILRQPGTTSPLPPKCGHWHQWKEEGPIYPFQWQGRSREMVHPHHLGEYLSLFVSLFMMAGRSEKALYKTRAESTRVKANEKCVHIGIPFNKPISQMKSPHREGGSQISNHLPLLPELEQKWVERHRKHPLRNSALWGIEKNVSSLEVHGRSVPPSGSF